MSEPEIQSEEQEAETEAEPVGPTDNVGDISVEVNVEELIAQLETEGKATTVTNGQARRKIEDILEEKRIAREIMDIDDYDIED